MGARVSRCGCVLLEKCGEAGRVVLKGPEPASPEDLAAQHHVQPLRSRLVSVLALVGDGSKSLRWKPNHATHKTKEHIRLILIVATEPEKALLVRAISV